MPFYFLPNLTASAVQAVDEPWAHGYVRPQFASKNEFREFCNNPLTNHAFVTAIEGKQPGIRVSEINPPNRMCGLVLDYDAIPPAAPALMCLTNAPVDLRPAYVGRSFSGNCRVIYRFENSVPLFSVDIAKEFLKRAARELKLRKLLPGFEVEALLDLSKTYEIGNDWQPVGEGDSVIPTALLEAWLADASRKHKWDREGAVVSIDALREQGEKSFPGKWPGGWDRFDVGARGPRFWDEAAVDLTAVIVRESGCQYYSEGGGFMTWEGIFGSAFINAWAQNRKGNAISNLWYDAKNYWRKLPTGVWVCTGRQDIVLDLHVSKQLTCRSPRPGQPSEIDSALHDIQTLKSASAALPFLYRPDGPFNFNGSRYLNISTITPIPSVAELCQWGEGFPWISEFLSSLFDPDDQLDYFVSWLKHFYMGAVTGDPKRGLALFIAGPVGVGKTILNKAILGQLMGGRQDAGAYLLGNDKFNDRLFGAALWNVDDEVSANDPKERAKFSQVVKKIVANDSFTYRAMYRSGEDVEWIGRVVVTMNDDPESLQMLPETEINILDKIMLLKTQAPTVSTWPSDAQIAAELPFFGAFLRDYVVPPHCLPEKPRFGVASYKHPDLLRAAGSTSVTSTFEEILQIWRKGWFAPGGPGENDALWIGNPTAFNQTITLNEGLRAMVERNFSSPTAIGMHLNKLVRRGVPYLARSGHRLYEIARPE